jgi:gluconate 2-dehydrogenase gamma chain
MITRLCRDLKNRAATPMADDQSDKLFHPSRRGFLGEAVLVATGAASMAPRAVLATAATTTVLAEALRPASAETTNAAAGSDKNKLQLPVSGYLSFGPEEAGFVEAMVDVMCPADELTPGGVDCGLAIFIDRQLAGGFGKGARLYMRGFDTVAP